MPSVIREARRRPGHYLHELICMMCGRRIEDIQSDSPAPPRLLGGLRCASCGGQSTFSGDQTFHEDRPARLVDDDDPLRPRVGRPPKWLVAARLAKAGA